MSRAAQHDILGLLPSVTLPLPPELLNLTVSLLAQSRSKASTLKQDEEIARGYACAHIACERLKQTLDLPAIVPRPPCPPRTYKKVFAYLNTALAPTKQAERPQPEAPVTPKKSRATPAKPTPNKFTPSKTQASKSKGNRLNGDSSDKPEWIMSVIRTLCKALKAPAAAPHVFTGVTSILSAIKEASNSTGTPSRKRIKRASIETPMTAIASSFDDKDIPALIAVVAMYTSSALTARAPPSGDEYKKIRQTAIKTLQKTVPDMELPETELIASIEAFMREAANGWLEMEWYLNIPQPDSESEAGDDDENVNGDVEDEDEEQDEGPVTKKFSRRHKKPSYGNGTVNASAAPKRAFGTMMTDATDWLSDDRKADYRLWKAKILKQIERVERQGQKA